MLAVIILLFELVILAIFKNTGTTDVGNFFASVLILIHALLVIASFNQNKRLRPYSKYLTIGLLLRLLILFIDVLAYPSIILPNGHGDEDMFYDNAVYYAEHGVTYRGYFCVVMGRLFRILGYNRLIGQYLCMLCSIVALTYLAYTFNKLDISGKNKGRILQIVCILPNFAILSSLFMREAVITMFLSISFYFFVRWAREKEEKLYYVAAIFVFPSALFHSGTIAVLAGYIVVRLIYDNKRNQIRITAMNVILTVLISSLAIIIINRSGGHLTSKFNSLDSLEDIANTNTSGASSYAQYVGNSNNPFNVIIFTPLRLFFFFLSPVPWMWRGIADVIAFLFSSMYFLTVIWTIIKFLRRKSETNRVLVIALFIIVLTTSFVFAWGTSNAGTATRHRDKLVTLFAILWALSADFTKQPSKQKRRGIRRYV